MKRLKRRYLALRLDADIEVGEHEFLDAVWAVVTKLYGEVGASLAGLALISYDVGGKFGVLRVNLGFADNVRTALATMTSIGGKSVAVHVVGVSGTIKGLHRQFQA